MASAISIERGCGRRVAGGIYACCPTSKKAGKEVEFFLIDPPRVVDVQELGIAPIGVKAIEIDGQTHVADWVGTGYPNVADFVEEVRYFGVSRRIPKTFDFSKLTGMSRMLLMHSRAHIENDDDFYQLLLDEADHPAFECPKKLLQHRLAGPDSIPDGAMMPVECCAGLWQEDVEHAVPMHLATDRWVERTMPAFTYAARQRPEGFEPAYKPAFFMSVPVAVIEVIKDPASGLHEEAFYKAQAAGVPTVLVDE